MGHLLDGGRDASLVDGLVGDVQGGVDGLLGSLGFSADQLPLNELVDSLLDADDGQWLTDAVENVLDATGTAFSPVFSQQVDLPVFSPVLEPLEDLVVQLF